MASWKRRRAAVAVYVERRARVDDEWSGGGRTAWRKAGKDGRQQGCIENGGQGRTAARLYRERRARTDVSKRVCRTASEGGRGRTVRAADDECVGWWTFASWRVPSDRMRQSDD